MRKNYKIAFTLAEILVALGVIGVVSAMTLPALIQNYQKMQTVNKLKTEYNKFANIINRSVSENGNVSDWVAEFNDVSDLLQKSALITEKYILPYIDGQTYKFRSNEYGMIYPLGEKEGFFAYYVSGTEYRIKNGTMFRISVYNNYLYLLLDIDNKIKKNLVGKDVFMFTLDPVNNTLKPTGSELSRNRIINEFWGGCSYKADYRYAGAFCAALIMNDGWKISDDYPWKNR